MGNNAERGLNMYSCLHEDRRGGSEMTESEIAKRHLDDTTGAAVIGKADPISTGRLWMEAEWGRSRRPHDWTGRLLDWKVGHGKRGNGQQYPLLQGEIRP